MATKNQTKANKTSTKTSKATKAEKTEKNTTKAEKKGLRKPQIKVLSVLSKGEVPLSRAMIASRGEIDQATLVEYIGSSNPEIRSKNDEKHFPSLLTLGYVKEEVHDVGGKDHHVYLITAKGKAALEAFIKSKTK